MDVPNSIQDIQGTTASRDFCLKPPRVSKGEMSRVVLKSCCWDVIPISTFKYHYGKRVFLIVQQCRYLWDKQQQHTTHVVQDSASQIVNTEVMGEMQQWTWCLLHWYMYILNIYIYKHNYSIIFIFTCKANVRYSNHSMRKSFMSSTCFPGSYRITSVFFLHKYH